MHYLLDGQESDRLYFRKILVSDFMDWVEFFNSPETSKHWIYQKEEPTAECKKWYDYQFQRHENNAGGMNAMIEKASHKLVGHCDRGSDEM